MSEFHRVFILLLCKIPVELSKRLIDRVSIGDNRFLPNKQISIQNSSKIQQISVMKKICTDVQKSANHVCTTLPVKDLQINFGFQKSTVSGLKIYQSVRSSR